jgi:peptidoglycan/xylan/chitin deacetylase (PgdA/CDA1 family)
MPLRPLAGHGRYRYRSITERPTYEWPGGHRLAVYLAFNLEHFEFGRGLGAQLAPSGDPDVLNYAWRDWGNRVGLWRCRDVFDALELPVAVVLNTSLYADCPAAAAAFRGYRWGAEIVGHGHTNAERQGDMSLAQERELIADCTAAIHAAEGRAPQGWLSPWISESLATPDLLAQAGYRYTLNWGHDDQPLPMQTAHGRIWAVPYPQEVNDIPAIVARRMSGEQFAQLVTDSYREMLAAAATAPLVMGIALHPYLVGQPARLRHLRAALATIRDEGGVWWCTPGQIVEYVAAIAEVAGLEP